MFEDLQILGAVALALLLGGLIGLERELAQKPAGLRTHMLVAGSACLFVVLGSALQIHSLSRMGTYSELVRTDPVRIIEAIVTGISFLGAGTILRSEGRTHIEGLTTAATILIAAAIGVAVAIERWFIAIGVVILVLATTRGMKTIENWIGMYNDQNQKRRKGKLEHGK